MTRETLKLDDKTSIVYENQVLSADILRQYAESSSHSPESGGEEDHLKHQIVQMPIEIQRDRGSGDLVLRLDLDRELDDETLKARERYPTVVPPYKRITLTPIEGAISGIRYLQVLGGVHFRLQEATSDHITFDHVFNSDVEIRLNYRA